MVRLNPRHGQGKLGCILWLLVLLAVIGIAAKLIPIKIKSAEFHDYMEEQVLFAGRAGTETLRKRIMGRAEDLKIPGIPNAAESIMVQRDITLAELTGARIHIAHVSTKESVTAIRVAKQAGISVTAETAPHYFTLTHDAVKTCGTNAKMNPPLRSAQDRAAIIEGLVDGTIDAIATDHAPHHPDEKNVAFEKAPNGIIGLETSLSLGLTLVEQGHLTLVDLIRKMSVNPSKILNIPCGLDENAAADITVIDLGIQTRINPESFQSKSRNTPFDNWIMKGGPFLTIVDGRIVYQTSNNLR